MTETPDGAAFQKRGRAPGPRVEASEQNLSGVENMSALPDAMFVIDSHAEAIAVREARRMGVPVVSIVDTNCDPDRWIGLFRGRRCAASHQVVHVENF